MPRKEIRSEKLTINASPQEVWNVLFDIERYGDWNPFTWKVESGMKVGNHIKLYVRMPVRGDRMQQETICVMDEPRQMAWHMKLGVDFLLRARRDQYIEAVDANSCSYETVDVFEGLLAPLVYALFRDDVENGFNGMARALKERAERDSRQTN